MSQDKQQNNNSHHYTPGQNGTATIELELSQVMHQAVELAYEAGRMALTFCVSRPKPSTEASTVQQDKLAVVEQIKGNQLKVETKEDNSPVTVADKLINEYLVSQLQAKFPNARVVGEESIHKETVDLQYGDVFFVDPIDGTKEFIRNNGEWAIMIGMCRNGVPKVGVVYRADSDAMYYASEGYGCWGVFGKGTTPVRIHCNNFTDSAAGAIVLISRSHPEKRVRQVMEMINTTNEATMGSFGVKCALISSGKADLYINTNSCYWDACASDALLREAGGCLFDAKTEQPLTYKGLDTRNRGILFACPSCIKDEVLEAVKKIYIA